MVSRFFRQEKVSGLLTTSALSFAVLTVLGLSSDRLVDRPRRLGGAVECDADDDRLVCRIRRLVMIVCNGVPWVLRYRKLIMTHIEK